MQTAAARSRQRGYTLAEALVVIAIIGLVTGVSVPFFMNYLRANRIRSSASYFETALRYARQRAVTKHIQTRVSFLPNTDPGQYTLWDATYNATTGLVNGWTVVQPKVRYLDQGVTFVNSTTQPVADNYDGTGSATAATDGRPDIIFDIDGSALNAADPTAAPGTLTLTTNFKSVTYNRYQIQLLSVGTFQVTASHG
ncbi:MAG TPA: GspH/FimT family pseudopilin [Thermoanaerobaculia bacterium]|nr:GspH/FimT family pseudopilin [Thermoanaerobaculia bacterium]